MLEFTHRRGADAVALRPPPVDAGGEDLEGTRRLACTTMRLRTGAMAMARFKAASCRARFAPFDFPPERFEGVAQNRSSQRLSSPMPCGSIA